MSLALQGQDIVFPKIQFDETTWETAPIDKLFKEFENLNAIDPIKSEQLLNAILKRALAKKDKKIAYQAYYLKGLSSEERLAFNDALTYYEAAEKIIEQEDYHLFLSIKVDIAILYRKSYRFVEARKIYMYLIENATKINNRELLQYAYGGMGMLYYTTEDYENAIRYYEKAFQVAQLDKNFTNACIYLDNISEAYGLLKRYERAFENIKAAFDLAVKVQDTLSLIPLYERYGRLYAEMGDFERATLKIAEGLKICTKFEHLKDRNNLILAKAELHLKEGKIGLAQNTLESIDEKLINVNSLTKVFYELGNIYEMKKDFALAEQYFKKSQDIAEKNQFLRQAERNHRALYRIYRLKNLSNQALFHLEKANALHDSLFNYEKTGKVTELQFRYDLAQSEQKLKEAELKTSRLIMFLGTSVALLVVFILGYRIYLKGKTNRTLTRKNEEIEAQKQQLEASNHEILAKNKEIEAQKRQLEESNKMMQQFNYAVAHDLKEPLRNIGNFVSIIQRRYQSLLPEASAAYFEFVTGGVSRMGKMLEGLLKYSMASTGQVTEVENLDIGLVLNDVLQSLRLVVEERQALVTYPSVFPKIMMNRIHLTQIFQNLLSNALKFVEQNPMVEIDYEEKEQHILIFIKDNGIGINAESGKKLFNLFHRLHRDSQKFEGTGVGLALCKSVVEKYGGRIWFESVEHQGTTFFLQFPKSNTS
jgi:signal transduction histidine kinase